MAAAMSEKQMPLMVRLWLYQAERFPLLKHGVLIASFSASAVCLSALLRGQTQFPSADALLVSFALLLTLFLQLRIADEFKDADDDRRFRPQRPVPRGLVTLKELAVIGITAGIFQAAIILTYHPPLLFILLAVWAYMALMSAEFLVSTWLKSRLFLYMTSHMLIMPLIDFLATACDWFAEGASVPAGLIWFLIISFFNGVIIELGRKTWAPDMEIPGVESYSASWGMRKALCVWGGAIAASLICALIIAHHIGFVMGAVPVFSGLALMALVTAFSLSKQKTKKAAARLENISGLWVFCIYLFLGIIPMAVKTWL